MGRSDRLHVADRGQLDPAWLLQHPSKPVAGFGGAGSTQPVGEGEERRSCEGAVTEEVTTVHT